MTAVIKHVLNKEKADNPESLRPFGLETAEKTRKFHESFQQYSPTPLVPLRDLAAELGVAGIFVKDESPRFGLEAFKVLGGSYMIGSYIAKSLGLDISDLSYPRMISPEIRKELGEVTFITATDGNHGRGVAWTANQLRQKAIVYMPKGTAKRRIENIQAENAEVRVIDGNYDYCVSLAKAHAEKNGWILTQDTTSEGYSEFPVWCMQGYTTMAYEAYEQLLALDEKPTHIIVQAGVGSLAGAVLGFFASQYGEDKPFTIILEPTKADCFLRTVRAGDGELHIVTGDMDTIMAGLACGKPCSIAWDVLRDYADAFIACEDSVSAKGMRVLANPRGRDPKIISGESGAVGVGLLAEIMGNPGWGEIRKTLRLGTDSKVLCFSTEGATDPENYRRIVAGA